MPRCYQEYLALGKGICAKISFKEYIYCKYGFWPKNADESSFERNKSSIDEPSCSTQRKEEYEKTKFQATSKPSIYHFFMRLFGSSPSRVSKGLDLNATKN